MLSVDLNCDLGEGYGAWRLGNDPALLKIVTSANVACGFHAGDPNIMREVCRMAADGGVTIGAQVSYHDRVGFGRRYIDVAPKDLTNDVIYQIGALAAFADAAGSPVAYVKPHGALYHAVNEHPEQASAVAEGIRVVQESLRVLCMAGSGFAQAVEAAGLRVMREAYADRAYDDHGRLRPRHLEGAVLTSHAAVVAQAESIVIDHRVVTHHGAEYPLTADSICIHGDTPGAVDLARAVRQSLQEKNVTIESFVPRR